MLFTYVCEFCRSFRIHFLLQGLWNWWRQGMECPPSAIPPLDPHLLQVRTHDRYQLLPMLYWLLHGLAVVSTIIFSLCDRVLQGKINLEQHDVAILVETLNTWDIQRMPSKCTQGWKLHGTSSSRPWRIFVDCMGHYAPAVLISPIYLPWSFHGANAGPFCIGDWAGGIYHIHFSHVEEFTGLARHSKIHGNTSTFCGREGHQIGRASCRERV